MNTKSLTSYGLRRLLLGGGLGLRLVLAVSCLGTALGLQGQDLPYNSGSTGADGPGPFAHINVPFTPTSAGHGLAFDSARNQLILCGITAPGYARDSNTWTWAGSDWVKRSGTMPPGRYGTAMAYDAERQEVVLFGGVGSSTYLNDTWIWNGTTWTNRIALTNPPPRLNHLMAYDFVRKEVVMFGGMNNSGLTDTWIWDGTNWAQKVTSSVAPEYDSTAMAYDEARHELVLLAAKTWVWNGQDWAQRSSSHFPGTRSHPAVAYDAVRQQIVLFGGAIGDGLNDTWVWDGVDWTQRQPQHNPPRRYVHTMAFDATRTEVPPPPNL